MHRELDMRRMTTRALVAILLAATAAACAGVSAAASLQLEMLPANARWVVHLDAKALRDSPPGKELLMALAGSPQEADLRAFEAMAGCDVRRDMTTLTACGAGNAEQGGVACLHGNWNLQRMSACLAGTHLFTAASCGRHATLNSTDTNGIEHSCICLVSSNLVLLANRETAMRQTLDALDGKVPTLATVPRFRRMAAMDTNAFLRVLALDWKEIAAGNLLAAAVPAGNSLRLALSAAGQDVCAKAVIQAGTPEAAQQMQQTLVGLQAVLVLQGLKNPDIGKMAQSARIDVNGQDVSMHLTAPFDTVKRLFFRQKKNALPSAAALPKQA